MSIDTIVGKLIAIAWGPWMLLLLVGTGVYLSCRVGFIQFARFGYAMRNTLGKIFKKTQAGEGEVTREDLNASEIKPHFVLEDASEILEALRE